MQVVIDIEANGLKKPTQIWCIVCKDIDTGDLHVFRRPSQVPEEAERFRNLGLDVTRWIGHNLLGYDLPVLQSILGITIPVENVVDTLVVSKLLDYPRDGHSLEHYGEEFKFPKGNISDFSKYSEELVTYCVNDVHLNHKVYTKYSKYINDPTWKESLDTEQLFQQKCINTLESNGFHFNIKRCETLLEKVMAELTILDKEISDEFPPREVLIREFTPKATKHGTISKTSVPRSLWGQIADYEVGGTYRHTKLEPFNPSSHKQLIDVLTEAGWRPVDKTKTHIELDRELARLKHTRGRDPVVDLRLKECHTIKIKSEKYGWKINENNLATLPPSAPSPARKLAKRILLEARRRTLVEWLALVDRDTSRIHGRFYGIGAWTHRMAHQNPNTANIPGEFKEDGSVKLYGKEMRSLWTAPKGKLLLGVDADAIQLRIFAHYIDDPDFTKSLVEGKKEDKSDPHSFNASIIGCSRKAAKRFIFAFLLGAGLGKLAEILGCTLEEAEAALGRLLERYSGLAKLKAEVIPADAKRGWFLGLDGRKVRIPGETPGARKHLAMSGYLQNGEAVVMKKACLLWHKQLEEEKLPFTFVNFVHDEWQTEVPNNMEVALRIAQIQADALRIVGEELNLKCPLAGSYWNDDHKDYTIGVNWYQTH